MTDTRNRFDHDRSTYERPNFPYRCGREAAFGRPCPRGPTAGGACQGVADCQPFRTRKVVTDAESGEEREILRWECRRPSWAGGPCAEGPRPDGSCSCVQPPCAPIPSLRRKRGRWAVLAMAAVVAFAIALVGLGGTAGIPSSVDPGGLSGKHMQFTGQQGCVSCHVGHSATLTNWASALFERKSISDACVSCHSFGAAEMAAARDGEAKSEATEASAAPSPLVFAAHNTTFPERQDAPTAACVGCHTEHRGEEASITPVVDGQCQTCHTQRFESFSTSHPAFGSNFPHERPRTIKFSHVKHFNQHFTDARYSDKAPAEGCVSCHSDQADGRLLPGSFEAGCAACHQEAITGQGFAVFGLPELNDPELTAESAKACGFAEPQLEPARGLIEALKETMPAMDQLNDAMASDDKEAMTAAMETLMAAKERLAETETELNEAIDMSYAVSVEYLTPTTGYLLDVPTDDLDGYSDASATLLGEMTTDGVAPLAAAIEERGGDPAKLLAGLSPDMVAKVACAWAANAEYYPVGDQTSGWIAREYSVAYVPTGHADPVVKDWVAFALAARASDQETAEEFYTSMLDESEGPGRCIKCHVTPDADAPADTPMVWRIPRSDIRPFTQFDHEPHLNVLDQGKGCATCHRALKTGETLADDAKRPGAHPNEYKPIEAAVCAECHHKGGVTETCGLCHNYHTNPTIRPQTAAMRTAEADASAAATK